jgi:hypothetical protein
MDLRRAVIKGNLGFGGKCELSIYLLCFGGFLPLVVARFAKFVLNFV